MFLRNLSKSEGFFRFCPMRVALSEISSVRSLTVTDSPHFSGNLTVAGLSFASGHAVGAPAIREINRTASSPFCMSIFLQNLLVACRFWYQKDYPKAA